MATVELAIGLSAQNKQIVDQRASAFAGKGHRGRDAFAGWSGDGEGEVAFSSETESSHARSVFNEQGCVHGSSHDGHVANVAGVDDAGMAISMFGLLCALDSLFEVTAANEGNEGHHLFGLNEGVVETGLTVEKFDGGSDRSSGGLCEFDGVLAEQFFAWSEVFICPFSDDLEGCAGQSIDFGGLESHSTSAGHCIHHRVENAIDDEDFFFGDAQKVIVVGRALDDATRCEVEVCCFVDDDRWVSWSGDDGSFTAIERGAGHRRSTGDADQSDFAMFEELLCGFEGWFADEADDIIDADLSANGFVEASHTFGGDLASAWVRVYHEGVATCDHTYGVTGDGG